MSSEETEILDFNIILNIAINNLDKLFTTKVSEHIPSGFLISTIRSIKYKENKHDVYRGKDCMEKFFESIREHPMKITDFKRRKISY